MTAPLGMAFAFIAVHIAVYGFYMGASFGPPGSRGMRGLEGSIGAICLRPRGPARVRDWRIPLVLGSGASPAAGPVRQLACWPGSSTSGRWSWP
ncbi:hypothetical protein E1809_17985 [Arthrobacter terricola]|uniref:Uncharacterized protein n=1 Tax=Arthrobacter terricola TaxID=2547396 RepID=A0A4R5KBC4_9MICC|nr:hypothetical protein E1809_17985 [Arthrobacter terricola]